MQKTALEALIEPVVTSLGYDYVGCEVLKQGESKLLRIYIENNQGITANDCASVSRRLGTVFEVENPFSGRYYLEISSPGLERRLFTPAQYQRFVGQRIRLTIRQPQTEGRRRFTGILIAVEGDMIKVKLDDNNQLMDLAFSDIAKANLVANI